MMPRRFTIPALCLMPFAVTPICDALSDHATVIKNFVGTWKEDQAKRKLGSMPPLRFQRSPDGELQELRGPEARPLIQPLKFGNAAYSVDNSKNTILWKRIDGTRYERQLFESGKLITTRQISLSNDGKTLTEVTRRKLDGGDDSTILGLLPSTPLAADTDHL
jgi:hypothetical protein